VLARELAAMPPQLGRRAFARSLGLLGAIEVPDAPADAWERLGKELGAAKLSLHVEPRRGTAIFAPPLCISESELVAGLRAFARCAVAAFGGKS
jgi:adenosylmethionine-8-amino-7-oxononanoate aminotransferase